MTARSIVLTDALHRYLVEHSVREAPALAALRAETQAMPEARGILACDVSEEWTAIARRHWQAAGVAHKVELVLRPAAETLERRLAAGEQGRYDFAFIDADKVSYARYYKLVLDLLHPGGVIAVDNT